MDDLSPKPGKRPLIRAPRRSLAGAKTGIVFLAAWLWLLTAPIPALAASNYRYELFKNPENFGIVVFPKENLYPDLANFIQSIDFASVESGDAVMRFGTKRENQTYMMPEPVQKKHNIEKFVILQVLADQTILVGIYDPQWGLTLPQPIYTLDEVRENIPKTLDIFRGKQAEKKKERGETIQWRWNGSPPDRVNP